MTRRISKSGRAYTVGSQATWSEGDSRVCAHCGKSLTMTTGTDALWIHTDALTGEHRSSHVACGSPLAKPPQAP